MRAKKAVADYFRDWR